MRRRAMKTTQRPTEQGFSTLETALTLTLIVLPLMFGIMDFSRAMYAYHFVAHAAREGSRWASVRGAACAAPMTNCSATSTQIQTFVQTLAPTGLYVVAASPNSCSGTSSGSLCATATWSGKEADGTTDCTSSGSYATNYPGCLVQVQVTYYYGFTLPFLSNLGAVKMPSTSQMTISQ